MKISVVMTTYNGKKHIYEQLCSLANQTRKPDQLLIFDDCSTDDTVSIVKRFIEMKNLCNWKIIENESNLGWRKNFMFGLLKAEGDYIFPCDQDDIWSEDKIEKMTDIFRG